MRKEGIWWRGKVAFRDRCLQTAIACVFVMALFTPNFVSAAPSPTTGVAVSTESSLGGGAYHVTASVFAEGTDGQVGTTASSGHLIKSNDNLVALPACTESSCPWVALGTGTDGKYGPQTTCAESDGLCWVQIVSDRTGQCTVAPVHDRGPLFIRDNWWAPRSMREYDLPQGTPAAEAARDGANLGFGAGISDVGHDIQHVYTYAAGIDLAGGTWKALGLATSLGVTGVTVTMLWQAGINHSQACSGNGSGTSTDGDGGSSGSVTTANPNATVKSSLNLRSGAGTSYGVLAVMPSGARIKVTGSATNGYYPVTYGTTNGYASGTYLTLDAGTNTGNSGSNTGTAPSNNTAGSGLTTSSVNMRSGPGTSYTVLLVIPSGATVTLTGDSQNGFLGVRYNSKAGWASSTYVKASSSSGSGSSTSPGTGNGTYATVINGTLNLRSGPGTSYSILTTMPNGAKVQLTGKSSNGFLGVIYGSNAGWASSTYLSTSSSSGTSSGSSSQSAGTGNGTYATVINGSLNLRSGAGTSYSVLVVMPGGAQVELTGKTSNGFSGVVYNGQSGWASSQYLSTSSGSSSNSSTSSTGTATVIDGTLNLRSGPGSSYSVLLVMPDGATVTLLGSSENGYLKVSYNGTQGWAFADYLD